MSNNAEAGIISLYSDVKATPIKWLWYPFFAIGKISLLQGDPGDGKSTMMLRLIAELSNGGATPDGQALGRPQRVLYQCSEDGVADTIKPRLEACGADCRNVAFINEELYSGLTLDDERLRQAIIEFRPRLVVIDPIQAYIGSDSDLQIAGRARKLMSRLGMWASTYDCAIVLIGHLNKKEGTKGLYRSLGSIDVVAAARSVDIYSDEGISGTQINHREGLQRLLEDCKAGKIDYIITKSISRFARNIVDCLNMIEDLRNLNPPVGVIFETDHIDTLGDNDSLLLSILASLAEAESRNKSDIMNWSIENRFSRGIFLLPELIGFDKDEDGNLVINEDEADTVRLCFYLFLAGFQLSEIADLLTDMERRTGYNKQHNKKPGVVPEYKTTWTSSSVLEILRNERHCGDVLARKTFTPNFKNHKSVKNRGERQQDLSSFSEVQ